MGLLALIYAIYSLRPLEYRERYAHIWADLYLNGVHLKSRFLKPHNLARVYIIIGIRRTPSDIHLK